MRKVRWSIAAAAIAIAVLNSATTAAPLAEFLLYSTEDKLSLNALLFAPKSATKSIVILIPGMTGGFSGGGHDYRPMAERLSEKGYAFMVPNMRTAGLHGMLFARFDDYTKDVAAAVAAAKSRGMTDITLFGTSLGGPRAIHYWTRTKDPAVKAMGFLASIKSPYLEAQLRFDAARRADFDAFLARCRDLIKQGRGRDVVTYENWFPGRHITLSAMSFVDIFGTLEESNASTIKFGPQLTLPAVVIHGTKDEIALPPNGTAIYDSLTAAPKREIVWVEGASHYLAPGPIAENYAKAVADWVSRAVPASQRIACGTNCRHANGDQMMSLSKHLRLWPGPAAALLALGATARAETVDELYAKAKNEKSLTIYAGGPVTNYEPLAREFERKFPGLTVAIEGGFSNVLNQKIEQQFKDGKLLADMVLDLLVQHHVGKLLADMVLFQTAQDFVRWKGEGRMLAFKPVNFDAIDKSFKDPDGAYIVWYVGTLSYAYNTREVKPENAPKSALDFLKPEFRGKMIACYPHDDDATLYLFHTIMQKYGGDYLEKYVANQPNWVQGHLSVSRSVAAGKDVVTLDATTSTILNLKKAGQPIEYAFSTVDPVPIYYSTAGIFKDAPHPNVAKLYLTWILEREQQSRIGTFSSRPDVPPPLPELKPLFSYNVANGYRDFVTNTALLTDLRKRFEAAVGPIRNVGGVR